MYKPSTRLLVPQFSLRTSFAAQRYWPSYRTLSLPLNAVGVVLIDGPIKLRPKT
ncbi:hypothetical protein BGW80DRAFT_1289130 [Lactifluus volemus]|nr:hypothetical protein BGW80DRAFT_1390838 [Lactifluus volemus]KAH9958185.1 hypothetical protein BGW80DRAFT_1376852 [Lactifluus volemus]KAH9976574.1 hypothetical protein BGW80DRAFT_1289130 [Lactifluus volemus]